MESLRSILLPICALLVFGGLVTMSAFIAFLVIRGARDAKSQTHHDDSASQNLDS